ncbi:hypothetical protein QFC22_004382 [Naganishia vaughanmartiniae]|uniref:Uncharacterized protein n=1 Tax=Naganishia vaughanmartiniae TaxID=1424756 RepID=A0ACC2X0Y0_9TREE|nr:hypothetical protein QFC22_004382 [Naganishia vaughanmartiniae]
MWAGKLGVGAHQRSPTPEDMSFLLGQGQVGGKGLSKEAMARLDSEADEFRRRRAGKEEGRRVEGMQWKARGLLKQFDEENGIKVCPFFPISLPLGAVLTVSFVRFVHHVYHISLSSFLPLVIQKFHPLWTIPSAPETTIPRPLLRLIDPTTAHHLDLLDDGNPASEQQAQARVQGRADEENMDEAGRLREQMRRDALVELDADDEANDAQEAPARPRKGKVSGSVPAHDDAELDDEQVDWASFVPGVQRVLAMSPSEHLTYLVSSLRADHLYCFWCAARYGSVQEMEGPGGCPGEEEEDH